MCKIIKRICVFTHISKSGESLRIMYHILYHLSELGRLQYFDTSQENGIPLKRNPYNCGLDFNMHKITNIPLLNIAAS